MHRDAAEPEILIACSPGERRVAVLQNGHLVDYALDRPGDPDGVGDLHLGRVTAVLPALGGAFVRLGDEDGFLPDGEAEPEAATLSEGDRIAVRVTRARQGGKGPRLTSRVDPAEREAACGTAVPGMAIRGEARRLHRGPDAIARLAAAWPGATIRCDDASVAAGLAPELQARTRVRARAFDEATEDAVHGLAQPEVALPGGLRASIHPTPALVAIDMDGAGSSAERRPKASVQFAANRDALPALLHQLRLRNLSGAILIDLAGVASRKRAALAPWIEAALDRDPLRPRLLGFTALGLAEILRPRRHPPLHELLASPLGIGLAALRAAVLQVTGASRVAATSQAGSGPRPALRAGVAVADALSRDPVALAEFSAHTGKTLTLRMDPALCETGWRIEDA